MLPVHVGTLLPAAARPFPVARLFWCASLYALARCFRDKKQYDMAREQLTDALEDLHTMDAMKKDVCYLLGEISEAMGDKDTAATYYKEIYQADIGYKDIAQKIEGLYG